jgi:hypothetical protein
LFHAHHHWIMMLFFVPLILLVSSSQAGFYGRMNDGIGAPCAYDVDCFLEHSYCKFQRTCECMIGFSPTPDQSACVAVVGTPCHDDRDCSTLANSFCDSKQGKCMCKPGSISSVDLFKCLRIAPYNSECSEDAQCRLSLGDGGQCKESSVCGCMPRYHVDRNVCFFSKGFGEHCNNNSDCYISENLRNTFGCNRNHICDCRDGYVRKESTCISGSEAMIAALALVIIASIFTITF